MLMKTITLEGRSGGLLGDRRCPRRAGPKRRFKDVRSMSAPGCKAEMLQTGLI